MPETFVDVRDVRPDPDKEPFQIRQYQGLSTDTKPTANVGSGSIFYELDTKKIFTYDTNNVNSVTSNGWWEM